MNKHHNDTTVNHSRRSFLKSTGGILMYMALPFGITSCVKIGDQKNYNKLASSPVSKGQDVNIWVKIHEDDTITIINPTNEMGQGSMTALALIIAEELDADWAKVRVDDSPVDAEIYGSPGWRGNSMMTVGSRTVMSYYDSLRLAGAQARYILLSNVAEQWNVPIDELSTEANKVIHTKSDRKVSYGEIASFVKAMAEIPQISVDQLKQPKDFRLIGKISDRLDIPSKVDGSAMYAIDVQIPDMVYAVISRSPVHGAKPTLQNEKDIRTMDGVMDIVTLDHGIGVVASQIEQALKARSELQIQWSQDAKAASHSSEQAYEEYEKVASSQTFEGKVIEEKGDVGLAMEAGTKTYTSDYKNDYVYHAQMEPMNVIVSIAPDSSSAELWIGTQAPARNQSTVAKMLGIEASQVKINRYYLGGGFGRKSASDCLEEGVLLAQAIKRPVKLIWTREDDIQYGMFRPMSLQRMQASVDDAGKLSAWQHTIVGTGGGLLASGAKTEFYTFPNQQIEVRNIDHGVRTKHWRSVGHGPNKFAIEAFIDEIAADLNRDPFELRMELMQKHPRAQKVLQTVADMANWASPTSEGRAKGIAFGERSSSLAACVCELSVNRENGNIKVHKLWAALDAGVVVQPANAITQMEGGLIMGMSSVLKERLIIKNGAVQQSNYSDYPILRMDEAPESIEVEIIPSRERPTGIGESSTPLVGGAIANAFAALTGKRLKHLPFTPDKVSAALNS